MGYWVNTHRSVPAAWRIGSRARSTSACRRGSIRLIERVSLSAAIRIRAATFSASNSASGGRYESWASLGPLEEELVQPGDLEPQERMPPLVHDRLETGFHERPGNDARAQHDRLAALDPQAIIDQQFGPPRGDHVVQLPAPSFAAKHSRVTSVVVYKISLSHRFGFCNRSREPETECALQRTSQHVGVSHTTPNSQATAVMAAGAEIWRRSASFHPTSRSKSPHRFCCRPAGRLLLL